MWIWCWFVYKYSFNKNLIMIILNGINSEIAKKILPYFLRSNKVIGIYNAKYTGPKNKNLVLFKKIRLTIKK